MNILDEIVEYKKLELARKKERLPISKIWSDIEKMPATRNFKSAISKPNRINLIAEIKRASPSAGEIVENFNVEKIAKQYEEAHSDAISVLTETKYFQGDIFHIDLVRQISELPILRKDFIVDEYQIYESRYFGADAVLLIAAILDIEKIKKFLKIASELNLSAIVEIHNEEELKIALNTDAKIVGINNRNLSDLTVDINTTLNLREKIPGDKIIISESGIKTSQDIEKLKNIGINAVLIGEHFMKSQDIKKSVAELFG
ncbi:MAG: indole-3-glycerol phosphate synthase [Elusimicrobia bacterium CG06_land_8_20_14_3_00_38_11]|nr:MAG: indole-3-glycerol phosphate synthase [Elusimicrobia bacterium CG06_land_8_20_14_3_00_38_11]